jgi:hypothetical protein
MTANWRAETKQCATCGAPFGPQPKYGPAAWTRRRYCSLACYLAAARRSPDEHSTCAQCGTRFRTGDRGQRFCSRACAHRARHAELARQREQMREAWH